MFVIGLTGGIGTGKSEVARILRELGGAVIDADEVAHETYKQGTEGWREVVAEFGEDVLADSGDVDRSKLAGIVFEDKERLDRLNAIVHPRTRSAIEARIQELRESGTAVVVVEAPLLVEAMRREARWVSRLDEVWVTDAAEDRVMERVRKRSHLDERAIKARIRSQIPREERNAHASALIDNGGTLEDLRERVRALWHARVPLAIQRQR